MQPRIQRENGNLHLYCSNIHIKGTRMVLNKIVTAALEDLYQMAETSEQSDEGQESTFQENLKRVTKEAELEKHSIISTQKAGKKKLRKL